MYHAAGLNPLAEVGGVNIICAVGLENPCMKASRIFHVPYFDVARLLLRGKNMAHLPGAVKRSAENTEGIFPEIGSNDNKEGRTPAYIADAGEHKDFKNADTRIKQRISQFCVRRAGKGSF